MNVKKTSLTQKMNPVWVSFSFLLSITISNPTTASLTLTDNGLGVYDNLLNVTWTQDANLLNTLESTDGYTTLIDNIIAASGVIQDTPNSLDNGLHTLSAADFSSGGLVDWWGAQAFVHYLNAQNYAGSSQWSLPTSDANNPGYVAPGYKDTNNQMGELFYTELNGTGGDNMPLGPFINLQDYVKNPYGYAHYWSNTESTENPSQAWSFNTAIGIQGGAMDKDTFNYVWAVSANEVTTAFPIPASIWLFSSIIVSYIGLNRSKVK